MSGNPPEEAEDGLPPVAIESSQEWSIYDILLNGQERYVQPLTFSDHVARLAHMVDWQALMGSKCSISEMNETIEESDEAAEPAVANVWDNVIKEVYAALAEINAAVDVLNVALHGRYLALDSVAREFSDDARTPNRSAEAYALVAKRKALSGASSILLEFVERQRQSGAAVALPGHVSLQNDESCFLRELTELRKGWRLKKAGYVIYGDLGYRTYGPKFRTNSTFEIRRKEGASMVTMGQSVSSGFTADYSSIIEIFLPSDLKEHLLLKTFIVPDVQSNDLIPELIRSVNPILYQSSSRRGTSWQETLEKAQKTLICRELFSVISKEALNMQNRICMVRGESIYVQIRDNSILVLTLVEDSKCEGIEMKDQSAPAEDLFFLEQSLMQMYISEVDAVTKFTIARPVSAPTYNISTRLRLAGPDCLSLDQMRSESFSEKLLLEQIAMQTDHYVLTKKVRAALDEFAREQEDLILSVHWCPETNRRVSTVRIQMFVPFYEHSSRSFMMIEIFTNIIRVTMKDCEIGEFAGDVQELIVYMRLKCRQHIVCTAGTMARPLNWQSLSCALNIVDKAGMPTPIIMLLSPCGNSIVRISYPLQNDRPTVEVCCLEVSGIVNSGLVDANKFFSSDLVYKCVDVDLLPGFNFLMKLEVLLAVLEA